MRWRHGLSGLLGVFAVALGASPTLAQWTPSKPIKILLMEPAGSAAERDAQAYVEVIKARGFAKQPIEIVPSGGKDAGDILAAFQRDPDPEHVLLFTSNAAFTAPLLNPQLETELLESGAMGRVAERTLMLWVDANRTDIRTIDDLVRQARAKGKGWRMIGVGEEEQFVTSFLNAAYGMRMTYVLDRESDALRSAVGEKRADSVLGGRYVGQAAKEGMGLKPVVTLTQARSKEFLATPTLRETGMDFSHTEQRWVIAGKAMPRSARIFYEKMTFEVFATKEWQSYLASQGLSASFLSGPSARGHWKLAMEKSARWKMAIELLGFN